MPGNSKADRPPKNVSLALVQVIDVTPATGLLQYQTSDAIPLLPLVALLVFSEAGLFVGFVLPGETAVLVAGVVASKGHVNVVTLCAVVVASAIAGDSLGYEVGRRYGERLLLR